MTDVLDDNHALGADPAVAAGQPAEDLPLYPMERKCPFQMPEEYERLRAEEPVSRALFKASGKPVWLVASQEGVRQVLTDPTVSSNWKNRGFPLPLTVPDEILQQMDLLMIALDQPEHTALRRMLVPEFTVKRMRALIPQIEATVDSFLDDILAQGPGADLVKSLAVPVPARVLGDLVGVPVEDRHVLANNAELHANRNIDAALAFASHTEMVGLFYKLVAEKAENPSDDLISSLVARNADGAVSEKDLVGLVEILVVGGLDTMASLISTAIALLLEHPDQLDMLKADPDLTKNAVHEILRYLSISDSVTGRVLTEDLEVHGVVIPAGDGVIAMNGSANRDPAAWENPDTFDVRRDAKGHSAFSHGIHQCIGASLAQVQLEVIVNRLFARIPDLRLAVPVTELPFKKDTLSYGLYELPVTW